MGPSKFENLLKKNKKNSEEKKEKINWKLSHNFFISNNLFNNSEKTEWKLLKKRIMHKKNLVKNSSQIGIFLIKNEILFIFTDENKLYKAELLGRDIKNVYSGQLIHFIGHINKERNVITVQKQLFEEISYRKTNIDDLRILVGNKLPSHSYDLFINTGIEHMEGENVFNCGMTQLKILPVNKLNMTNPAYISSEKYHIHVLNYDIIEEAEFINENFNLKEFFRNFLFEKNYFPFYKFKNYAVDYAAFSQPFLTANILLVNCQHNFIYEYIDDVLIINFNKKIDIHIKNNRVIS